MILLSMQDISKSFGNNLVLSKAHLQLEEGEIRALIGENGAGKSTLMNILGGVLQPDAGKINLRGEERAFKNPAASLDAGIAFIHQELSLINDLTVYENMYLGREIKKAGGLLDHRAMKRNVAQLMESLGVEISPSEKVSSLDASYKQIVEICRALLMKASVLIMDEPTTSLTEPEIERVFAMLARLKQQKVGVIFISHKLREVMQICDTYTVLRDGVVADEGRVSQTSVDKLAFSMVGHAVNTASYAPELVSGQEVLRLEGLSRFPYFSNVSLSVREAEIVGVTGLLGDGRRELFQAVYGDMKKTSGSVYFRGSRVRFASTYQAMKAGVGYVPGNRKENGILKDLSILQNATLTDLHEMKRGLLIDGKKEKERFESMRKLLSIKTDNPAHNITSLSGGNQQKVVLARWLLVSPKLLILDNPTQGVDVGAKEEIYGILSGLAARGMALVILSGEAQEIVRICHRAYVMYHGQIADMLSGAALTERNIMRRAVGG